MKNLLLSIIFLSTAMFAYSQEDIRPDTIFQLNGESIVCKVSHISEFEIIYSYVGESLTNVVSKKQVREIHFGSGRTQVFSEKIVIRGEEDWEKVQLTTLPSDVDGLVKKGEVKGTAPSSVMMENTKVAKKRAESELKREAAKLGAHIVLMQIYDLKPAGFGNLNISGVAYGYE